MKKTLWDVVEEKRQQNKKIRALENASAHKKDKKNDNKEN